MGSVVRGWNSVTSEQRNEPSQYPFRHPPDDGAIDLEGRNQPILARHLHVRRRVTFRVQQTLQRDPHGSSHLAVQGEGRSSRGDEHKRTYGDGWEDRGARYHVVESSG